MMTVPLTREQSPGPPGVAAHGEDAAAMALVAAGDERAFGRLYEAHRKRLYRLAYGVLLDAHEANDAVQETFLRLHRAAPRWEPRAAVGTWLYRVLLNYCLGLKQKLFRLARQVAGPVASTSPERQAALGEAVRIVERSLAALPMKQRAVACLFLEAELAPADIAPLVALTANATRVTLHRALERIRGDLTAAGIDAASTPDEVAIAREEN